MHWLCDAALRGVYMYCRFVVQGSLVLASLELSTKGMAERSRMVNQGTYGDHENNAGLSKVHRGDKG